MTELYNDARDLMMAETGRAKHTHGVRFASDNEGYGVLAEEIQEAKDEVFDAEDMLDSLLRKVRHAETEGVQSTLEKIQHKALCGACECIQIAAVCQKWMDSIVG